ncbi:TPA: hypothetical protein N0F65_003153, partial [Lagenidium giganteum]
QSHQVVPSMKGSAPSLRLNSGFDPTLADGGCVLPLATDERNNATSGSAFLAQSDRKARLWRSASQIKRTSKRRTMDRLCSRFGTGWSERQAQARDDVAGSRDNQLPAPHIPICLLQTTSIASHARMTSAQAAAPAVSDLSPLCIKHFNELPSTLQHREGKFKNARDQQLFYSALFPPKDQALRGIVFFLHGIGDHSRRYYHLFNELVGNSFGVISYDLVSHGGSDNDHHETRAHARKFRYFVHDTNEFLTFAKKDVIPDMLSSPSKQAELPLVFMGMSFGTLVGLHTILSNEHKFSAIILSAPAICVEFTPMLRLQRMFSLPMSLLAPTARIVPGVNAQWLSRNPLYAEDFAEDPLTENGHVTVRMGAQSLRAMLKLRKDTTVEDKHSSFCGLPILFLMGTHDKVTSLPSAKAFYERIANSDKEFKEFEGFYHCIFDEPGHEQVLEHTYVSPELQKVEDKFKNSRGQSLFYSALAPPPNTPLRAIVFFLHGIDEYHSRYYHMFERLCFSGFAVIAYDMLSHGHSSNDTHNIRAHARKFQFFVDDTNEFLTFAKQDVLPKMIGSEYSTSLPLVYSAMSYGTLVGLHVVLSKVHQFAAMVLVGPAVSVEMTLVLHIQKFFSKPLSYFFPTARIVPGVNRDWICRDPRYNEDFEADPLTAGGNMTARMGEQSLGAMIAIRDNKSVEDPSSAFCRIPIVFMMGSEDRVTSLPLAKQFYRRIANSDKEFKEFDGLFHCVFDEPERKEVLQFLVDWLTVRFPVRDLQ